MKRNSEKNRLTFFPTFLKSSKITLRRIDFMRECKSCVHYVNSKCSSWDCLHETLQDFENRCYDKFSEELMEVIKKGDCIEENTIKEISDKLKGAVE